MDRFDWVGGAVDRNRIIKQIKTKGVPSGGKTLKVLDTLGEGGNGVALLCATGGSDKVVAKIYVPPDKRDLDERALARFESEIKLTSTIRHPNVVRAIDSGKMALGAFLFRSTSCRALPAPCGASQATTEMTRERSRRE